jgi:hypothetical protein
LYGKAACELLKQLLPYLIEKRQRAMLVIELQSLDRGKSGNSRPPQEWIDRRDSIFNRIKAVNLEKGRGGINQFTHKKGVS